MKKICIKTYGCSFNHLDSQILESILANSNYEITKSDKEADMIIINSCTVKNSAETKLFNDINKYKSQNKKIIVCGCVPQAEPSYLKTKLNNISVIGINELDKITFAANDTFNNRPYQTLSNLKCKNRETKENLRLKTNKNIFNNNIAIIPINEGCLNACTYCKTKHARGNLFSYSIENIKKSFENAVNLGAKEIYLTSQDVACYGFDIKTNLPQLLKELIKTKGDYKIRIGMGNPNHFKKIIDETLEIIKSSDKIYKFLHIPLQSGSNRILKEMKRCYTIEDYNEIIKKCRKQIPQITIANDIIVAYPTETEEEFKETIKSLKQTNVLNFSRFWLRPNTPCETLYTKEQFIDGKTSKNRAIKLKEAFEKIATENNKKWIGWQGEVTITEKGKKGTNSFVSRNNYYKPIIILNPPKNLKIGDNAKIKIKTITWFDFRAEIPAPKIVTPSKVL
jgi:threonylcarbamoyladenosine tRNA methylthiotransferase CDKAL1